MADKGETTTVLEFDIVKTAMICNPTGKGVLFERRRNRKSTLIWRNYLTEDKKSKALIWVHSYKSSPPAKGTYVVLEFADSRNFIFGSGNAIKPQLCVGEPDGTDLPDDPEDITTPTDPRVFLMKPSPHGSTDVVFAWKGSTNDVITLLPSPNARNKSSGPCGLMPEGNGPTLESQLFQLNLPLLRKADRASEAEMSDRLEVVPFPFPFLPPGLESEARQA
ncbi:PREDICTED: uncharacterized protein LOC109480334 [Branchiostoma belcheri]|uniref:Uncharacterized protein LOC109480334 n=1 Tax=Branchiostoma belcheri TaxID=7741 RepID=A0A6P4ZVQ2_BRABE|nr:PREDICTED: uncharacterized protein LOC109480334 [Branchiostoma belcheri]